MRTSILYEDDHILVIYKPAGLATQTAKVGQADVVSELKNYLKGAYVGVVHRLDQPVEGLLVFGKSKEATAALTRQLIGGTLHKQYDAVLCGNLTTSEGTLVDYLIKTRDNQAQVVEEGPDSQKAVLYYKEKATKETEYGNLTLAEIQIETGRFHQIRAQMAHEGVPLLGDQKYGTVQSLQMGRQLGIKNVALCAKELTFMHPKRGQTMHFETKPQGPAFALFLTEK